VDRSRTDFDDDHPPVNGGVVDFSYSVLVSCEVEVTSDRITLPDDVELRISSARSRTLEFCRPGDDEVYFMLDFDISVMRFLPRPSVVEVPVTWVAGSVIAVPKMPRYAIFIDVP